MEAARRAGLPESDVVIAGARAAAHTGDVAQAASLLAGLVAADRRWLAAFEAYERLGLLPRAVLERLV
jgi:hypothetical protein